MSTDQSKAGGDADESKNQGGADDSKNQEHGKVSYESYQKSVDEVKLHKKKSDELARKLKEKEDADLLAQGKDKELIESLRTQLKEKESKFTDVIGTFAQRTVEDQIRALAVKEGCLDPDLLIAASREEFNKIQVDVEKGFTVNQDDVLNLVREKQKKHANLFKKTAQKLNDGVPGNEKGVSFDPAKLSSMKHDDLKKLLAMKLAKN